ncbi:MAG TPA: hypothetical protein VJT09_14125 [Pyrinomonadaceae bacterium]|nr:hypothetical protein [Pyrinomonadaceae bacterium]
MNKRSPAYNIVTAVLRLALLATLVVAGWNIYRRLPDGGGLERRSGDDASETTLLIVLRPSPRDTSAAVSIPVQLYPVDVSAVQREYGFEPRPGVRFEDFLRERMQGREPVKAQLDGRGQATVTVTPGRWWVHALLSGAQNVEWRLPVNVSGRQQTIELNTANIYARTKSF